MPELITQILLLIGIFFLIRFVLWNLVPRVYLTWLGLLVLLFVLASVFFTPDNRTAGILWGIISFPLRPLGLSLLLLGYALSRTFPILGGKAKATIGVPQVMSAFLILFLTSLPLTAYLLTAQTEQRTALEISQRPAGSVLGDGTLPTDPAYRVRTQLSNTVNGLSVSLESRLNYAAQLYSEQTAQGSAPVIIVSAGPQAILARPGVTSADAINAYLGRLGIPAEQVRVDNEGFDPRSSAIAVRRILLGPGAVDECEIFAVCNGDVRRLPSSSPQASTVIPVILVTPALTLRRSVSTFNNLAFTVTARPTDFYVFQLQGGLRLAALTDLIPNAEALAITTRVIDEYLAWLYYFMRGWLQDPLNV
jgi:hypothetical protein